MMMTTIMLMLMFGMTMGYDGVDEDENDGSDAVDERMITRMIVITADNFHGSDDH
jgi:hypothetical protein